MKTIQAPEVALRLQGQEQRVYLFLNECAESGADTDTIKAKCEAGNISAIAKKINSKFSAWGVPLRVACKRSVRANGHWTLVEVDEIANAA